MLRPFRIGPARSFRRDQDGAVAVITALVLLVIFGFAALSLNAGYFYTMKREQQSATDLAAFAAARNLGAAEAAARASTVSNGMSADTVSSIELGTYVADPTIDPAARFTPQTAATPNAVRVTLHQIKPFLFSNLLASSGGSGAAGLPITTRSVAATRTVAAFSLGSDLASLDGGILNNVLGALTGSTLSLSVMDYQALASANINLFTFSDALATRAAVAAGTYTSLGQTTVSLAAAVGAIADASTSSQARAALLNILGAIGAHPPALKTASLIDFGPYGARTTGSPAPMSASVSALALLSAVVRLANGQHEAATALNVSIPGILAASLKVSVGEPAVGSSLMAIGPTTTTLKTAQTRLLLTLSLAGPAQAPALTVPIMIALAPTTAVLNAVQCSAADSSASRVQLGVTPGLVDAWVGAVSDQALGDLSTPLAPSVATLFNVFGVLQITGQAHASIANTSATTVSFNSADIANLTKKSVSTTDVLSPLLSSLFGTTQLNITVLFGLINVPALNLATLQVLAQDTAPIDTILSSVLMALGLSAGTGTAWVSGVQCGQVVFVD